MKGLLSRTARGIRNTVMFMAFALSLMLPADQVMAGQGGGDELIIIVTDAQIEEAQGWIDRIRNMDIPVRLVGPADFDSVKNEKYLALMAVPGHPELNGDLLPLLLDADEIAWLSQPGNKRMYILEDKFVPGQGILLFGGASQAGSQNARRNSATDWTIELCVWFGQDVDSVLLYGY